MKKIVLGLLLPFALASLLRALPPGVASIPFTTSQAQFAGGDSITIQEVLAASTTIGVGTTVVVRGTYTLQSQAAAFLGISLTTTEPVGVPNQSTARQQIAAGTGTFEMEYTVQFAGTVYIAFTPVAGGASFGRIYFGGGTGGGSTPTNPTTPTVPAINTAGLTSVPFATSKAQFAAGDSITIQEVLASSPNIGPGDTVRVRGVYALQSAASATLAINLTLNAPGVTVQTSPSSRAAVTTGSGSFDLAYQVDQPGSLHVTFYSSSTGASFGGVYFSAPGAATGGTTAAIVSPATNTGLLGNLSIRSLVSSGAGALIAGVTVADRERYVLIRGVGPTLGKFGVAGVLAKPQLAVYNAGNELVASTGSWSTSFTAAQRAGIELLSASVGAFALNAGSDDAVLHLRLVPGSYTIIVSTGDGQPGAALMEVYASSTFSLPQ